MGLMKFGLSIRWLMLALLSVLGGCACFQSAQQAIPPGEGGRLTTKHIEQLRARWAAPSRAYAQNCAVCHGDRMAGAAQGSALVGADLRHGDSIDALIRSIGEGYPERGMPSFGGMRDADEIQSLAALIAEQRLGYDYGARHMRFDEPLVIPPGVVASTLHEFRLETIVEGLDQLPYSIAPLADGSILVTEKMRGLRIISPSGEKSPLIAGTPRVYPDDLAIPGQSLVLGVGFLMDVIPHPKFEENGWIYLHFTERCEDCNERSRREGRPVSMNKIVRGRIRAGAWVDEEVIWSTGLENYTSHPDVDAGGRLAFDDDGHLFFSIGKKAGDWDEGIQSLGKPYGKIYRLRDDGRIPADNPFVGTAGAIESIWTLGHRNPQGLEFDLVTGQLWSTEHGQRGGDEINHLLPGRNYGWPLHMLGMRYDGTSNDFAEQRGIEFDLEDIEMPVVSFTPSPAISSFVVYRGEAFPRWQGQLIVGTLRGKTLYRVAVNGNGIERKPLMTNLARIRDVEVDRDGSILLLVEHESGARILRMVPTTSRPPSREAIARPSAHALLREGTGQH